MNSFGKLNDDNDIADENGNDYDNNKDNGCLLKSLFNCSKCCSLIYLQNIMTKDMKYKIILYHKHISFKKSFNEMI